MLDRGNPGSKVCAGMCSLESVCVHTCVHSCALVHSLGLWSFGSCIHAEKDPAHSVL